MREYGSASSLGGGWATNHSCPQVADLQAQLAAAEARIKELEDALQGLYDEQNDAPLEKHRLAWEAAMANAADALKP